MQSRLLVIGIAAITLGLGVQSGFAAKPQQTTATATATAGTPAAATATATAGTPATATATATAGTPGTATATATATAVPPTATATTVPTAVATATATPIPVPAVGITAELLPNPPGVTARFTVSWTSSAPGQGQIRFGTTCNGLVETGTRDQHAGTTQHAVIVTGNDLPSSAGDVGIAPGTTYFFEIVTITKSGEVVDNNSGKCYSVTIPNVNSVGTTRVLTATLSGANEVPAGAPGSSGTSTVTINTSTNTVCYSITVSGITLPAIAAHIHRGAARVNGPVVIPFNPPGVNGITNGCTTADPALLQDIVANPANYYVNVHTTEFPGGALRGQLGTARVLTAQLSANNEIPAGPPGGAGAATVTVNTSNNTVCYTLSVTGIRLPAIAAHIHRGAASVNGPVVVPFNAPGANGTSTGCTAADPALLQDIVTNPANYYVNVHTTDFPGGAIRGQLG